MAIKFTTSSIDTPSYNTWSINTFNGVDYTTVPTSVDETRAIDASNYLPYGNALRKRYGWEMVMNLSIYKVYNIWKLKDIYIFYTHNKYTNQIGFYVTNSLSDSKSDLVAKKVYDYDATIDTSYSYGIVFENKLFILAMDEYWVVYYDSNTTIKKVSDIAYVPTVYTGINASGHNQSPTQVQEFNLLINKAKLSLIWYPPTTDEITFTYDLSSYFTSKTITKVDITSLGDTEYSISDIGVLTCTDNVITLTYDESFTETWENIRYINLEVTFNNLDEDDKVTELTTIQKMRFGIAYGTSNYRDRLFLSGNPDYPNMDVHSCETNYDGSQSTNDAWLDYTYFGDNSYQLFGSSDYAITGYGVMSNGYMAIFKEPQQNMPNMYIRTANVVSQDIYYTDTDGNSVDSGQDEYIETYAITPIGVNIDTTTPNQVIMYGNDLLVNTPKGIYKIVVSSSTATQTYETVEMSYFIRNDIDNDISNSCFAIYDGKLYVTRYKNETLASGETTKTLRIYVADYNRYSVLNSNYIYEWWVLDGINASKFFVFDDELYFIDDDRGLCKFGTSYRDMYRTDISNITINDTTISSEIFIDSDNDLVTISITSQIITDIYQKEDRQQAYETLKNNSTIKFGAYTFVKLDIDYTNFNVTTIIEDEADEATTSFYLSVLLTDSDIFNYIQEKKYPIVIFDSATNQKVLGWIDSIINVVINDDNYVTLNCNSAGLLSVSDFDYTSKNISFGYIIDRKAELSIAELYYVKTTIDSDDNSITTLYPFSDCTLVNDIWYCNSVEIGTKDDVCFNEFKIKDDEKIIDFEFIDYEMEGGSNDYEMEGLTIFDVSFTFYQPVESYWYCKYSDMGVLNYLKTADHITFLPDTRLGGQTKVGYRTSKYDVYFSSTRASSVLDFNDIDFDNFSFGGTDIAQSYSSRKKIKNFSFMQVRFSSSDEINSTIAELAVRYKVTKLSKGTR